MAGGPMCHGEGREVAPDRGHGEPREAIGDPEGHGLRFGREGGQAPPLAPRPPAPQRRGIGPARGRAHARVEQGEQPIPVPLGDEGDGYRDR
jgi:hypothetical protein